ncbi:MAG: 5-oxoprolinase subunit PxpB [Candidatus Limnocylindrales bacterium]
MTSPRIVPFGDGALLVMLGEDTSVSNARRAQALAAAIGALRLDNPGLGAPVPGAASVLVPFQPLATDIREIAALLTPVVAAIPAEGDAVPADVPALPRVEHLLHLLHVRYGGDSGPDLEAVAAETGLSPDEVVEVHAAASYEVMFLGFAPGFAYLGELPAGIVVPRLATPRVRVPAGSVAIAGTMTAVYPHTSAGGWRLIGTTTVRLFDPEADPPALLRPGDRVRFVPA